MYNDSKKTDFQTISPDLNMIVEKLLSENDLCKMLYFTNSAPLKEEMTDEIKGKLFDEDYITIVPIIHASEIEKNSIAITFDNFIAGISNPQYMNATIIFDILCPLVNWKMKNKFNETVLRPYELAHIVHKSMQGKKLSGIGRCNFSSASEILVPANSKVAGLTLRYTIYNSDNDGAFLRSANDSK